MKKLIAATLLAVATLVGVATGVQATNKVTICHAAGLDGTMKYVTLTVAYPAVYGPAGHFYENGTPRAGHENDYLGPCTPPETTTTTTSVVVETTVPVTVPNGCGDGFDLPCPPPGCIIGTYDIVCEEPTAPEAPTPPVTASPVPSVVATSVPLATQLPATGPSAARIVNLIVLACALIWLGWLCVKIARQ